MPLFMVGGVNVSTIIDKKERNLLINSEILKKATETKKFFIYLIKEKKLQMIFFQQIQANIII